MPGGIRLDEKRRKVFEDALRAMAEFRNAFGRPLRPDFVVELHVADKLGLEICGEVNRPGFDALGSDGTRYQIKKRSEKTQNIDINNFDFDELVLVNLDEDYHPKGIWRMSVRKARRIFVRRDKFRKFQTTQKKFKANAERIV